MKKLILLFLAIVITSGTLLAQPLNKQTPDMMADIGDEEMEKGNYYGALEWYEKAYEDKDLRSIDLQYKIAKLHYILRDYKKSTRWHKRVVEKNIKKGKTNPYLPEALFVYGKSLKMEGKYDESIEQLEKYIAAETDPTKKAMAQNELTGAQMALGMTPVTGVIIENAGKPNTKLTESSPTLGPDGDLYYSSFLSNEVTVLDGKQGDYHFKVVKSGKVTKRVKQEYAKGKALTSKINREGYHTGNISFSKDGETMYFTRMQLEGDALGESKLYYSEKDGKRWQGAKEVVGIDGDYLVRHPRVGEHFGNEVLFFTSNMEGGSGGFDIYYATKKGDGVFGDPINVGETINSTGDDETPYYRDGVLYFSSNGHPGIGGFDIFSSSWNGSNWSKPENLGKGYNSPVDDLYFSLDPSGNNGVLVSNRVGTKSVKSPTCCDDIFLVTIPEVVLELLATTFDEKEQPLNGASIQLIEMVNKKLGDTDRQENANGNNFGFTLGEEKSYMIIAQKEDFYPDTAYTNTVGLTESTTIEKQLSLKPVPPPPPTPTVVEEEYEDIFTDQPIELSNIYFDFDDDKILPDAEQDLTVILDLMRQYPDMVIELGSHTDAQGNDSYNQRLSARRATSSKEWLVDRGVKSSRIKAVGYGETQIRNQCVNGIKCDDELHRQNRRTEFKIISGPTSIRIKKTRLKKRSGNGGIGGTIQDAPKKKVSEIKFEKSFVDLGTLNQGEKRSLKFKFTNTGTEAVKIDFATGSCGCTVPDWPRKTFQPGESGSIDVEYDSKDKEGEQDNSVDVYLTATDEKGYPLVFIAKFKAFVKTK